ncbi:MAG: transposase [Coleofasciculus sp. A1-SPW-01]|uniref:RNA-guided endonuclease InsQ/TnpB family protein n=1 Tax=Coleofasciculus sp. A1-SPW-01 TaxID=3070819 RepID=UPI0033003765
MIVFEFKVKAKPTQYAAIDEAIQTSQFVRNKCLRYWMDNEGASKYDLNKYCSVLAKEFSFASELNSQARQASAERAWTAISRFYENCRKVETRHGASVQGFLADSNGHTEESPKFYRKSERQLNRANRKKSKKYRKGAKPQSRNYHKARKRYARKHLRVSRQRKEYCKRVAYSVIQSNDLVAYEDLNVKGLVKNRHLSKSISDAGWSMFRQWLEYFGHKYGKVTVAVPPHYTSQDCPKCHDRVKKSLSQRTHVCGNCGYVEDRDIAASLNILQKGLSTVGHTGTYAWGDLPSWAVGAILSSNGKSKNQESPLL